MSPDVFDAGSIVYSDPKAKFKKNVKLLYCKLYIYLYFTHLISNCIDIERNDNHWTNSLLESISQSLNLFNALTIARPLRLQVTVASDIKSIRN